MKLSRVVLTTNKAVKLLQQEHARLLFILSYRCVHIQVHAVKLHVQARGAKKIEKQKKQNHFWKSKSRAQMPRTIPLAQRAIQRQRQHSRTRHGPARRTSKAASCCDCSRALGSAG
jgi:hypothetical protein